MTGLEVFSILAESKRLVRLFGHGAGARIFMALKGALKGCPEPSAAASSGRRTSAVASPGFGRNESKIQEKNLVNSHLELSAAVHPLLWIYRRVI